MGIADFDDYARELIKHKARQLVGKFGFTPSDREDLEQEMILDLIRRLPQYDPSKAARTTFISRIVEHKVASLIEARTSKRRDFRMEDGSLNDQVDVDHSGIERLETVDAEQYLLRTGAISMPLLEQLELGIDIARVVMQLPDNLRELCIRLQTQSVTEISRETGVPRYKLYESIKTLRAVFEKAGLKKYL